ncbi:Cytochrome c assembly protein [Candidatus Sulfotelmatobacter kueseliae]|uniref:Cytochrome c assembly protein n=1 Tax=Candidatus Sulfotelmatobacter kueseliae TaxID=2042962 RepID=A0A2U3KXH5_9BACT|nr:Cytochrome c assembly protein [Candidatus Sulfotelmatobacter kueseliae]
MARARAEQQPATGTTLIVLVGLSIAFLLFMAFLNVVKSGSILNESNMLYAALIFYAGAGALYLGFGVTATDSYIKFASLATWAGLVANTLAVAHRWYEAGHPPFASIYEMLLSFVWTLAALTLIAEKRYGVKVIGTVTMPVAIVGVVLMQLLRTEVHPLVPALQSTWLHVHVTLAMLAYAACALSFALAMMFLIQDKMRTESFLAATSMFTVGIYAAVLSRFERWGGLNVVAWDAENKSEVFISRGVRLFVTIPDLGWMMLLVFAAVAAPLVLYVVFRLKKNDHFLAIANRAVFISILLQILALVFFLLRARDGQYPSLDAEGLYQTSLAASPFILSALVGGIFANLLYLLLLWRRPDLERHLPDADALDRITYKTICIAFPLLTLMIAAGAYWANRAWPTGPTGPGVPTGTGIPKRRGRRLPGWCTLAICTCALRAAGGDGAPLTLRFSALPW